MSCAAATVADDEHFGAEADLTDVAQSSPCSRRWALAPRAAEADKLLARRQNEALAAELETLATRVVARERDAAAASEQSADTDHPLRAPQTGQVVGSEPTLFKFERTCHPIPQR